MTAQNSIRRKLVTAIMLTSSIVLVLTGAVLVGYESVSFRAFLARNLSTRAEILAEGATAALAFQNNEDAEALLATLKTDPAMDAAALYDVDGRLLATYPAAALASAFPRNPREEGHRFTASHLVLVRPVKQGGHSLGTLYLRANLVALKERLRVHVLVVLLAVAGSIGVAFGLSTWLQRSITRPVLLLADAARAVSERKDYGIRAKATSDDEVGVLNEAFNGMLAQIQQSESALRTGEARLRAILESALDCIITMDHWGKVVEFNPAAERLFGHPRASAVGADLADLIIPAGLRESHRQGLRRYLATGEAFVLGRRLELAAVRADGSEFDIELSITRIPQDGPAMFTGFIRDISERKRAEQEIRQLNADLEVRVSERTAELASSNRELESFSYSVSHDLRTPLRAIDGFSKAILEDCSDALSPEGKGYLARVRNATAHMGNLIDDILDLARLSRAEMYRDRVDLGPIAQEIAGALHRAQPERRVGVVIAPDLVVDGDAALLRVVLDNLLSNAWKFTSKHPQATIELGHTVRDGKRIFFVRDDGAGFDMEHAKLLFTPFQRLHRQSDFEGTGVGLATVQRIIGRHGGRLWAESAIEKGATFYFTLEEKSP